MTAASALHVGVVLGDPRLPYPYAAEGRFGEDELQAVEALKEALGRLDGFRFSFFDDHARLLDELRTQRPELVLNLCDTGFRNDWNQERNIPALLEILAIPYSGADPMGIVLSNDKALVAAAARLRGVPVPDHVFIDLHADPLTLPTRYPALIKPNVAAGSFGITEQSVVHDAAEADAYLRWLAPQLDVPEALAQDFLPGAEYTLGVIGNPGTGLRVLPPLEVDWSALDPGLPRILTHASKADPASPYWKQLAFRRAELDEVTRAHLVEGCARLFGRLGFRDYARFDFRNGADGLPRLLDANTNPTWYQNGKLALMAEWEGHAYHQLLEMILEAAMQRYGLCR